MNAPHSHNSRSHGIVVRKIPFAFDEDISPVWNDAQPEWSHMINGASLTMPYLEPFLIRTVREILPKLTDAGLREDARDFIA
ncbi:MAG: metal-dependent hydrolase, partial [Hyphomicrobiales bacterium]|nr:metal-dependent hydrolase [Hyphomicrobiales bacterium]